MTVRVEIVRESRKYATYDGRISVRSLARILSIGAPNLLGYLEGRRRFLRRRFLEECCILSLFLWEEATRDPARLEVERILGEGCSAKQLTSRLGGADAAREKLELCRDSYWLQAEVTSFFDALLDCARRTMAFPEGDETLAVLNRLPRPRKETLRSRRSTETALAALDRFAAERARRKSHSRAPTQ